MRVHWSFLLGASLLAAVRASAQHEGHVMGSVDSLPGNLHVMAQAIPLVTRANPSAGGISRAEGALTQTVLMARASGWNGAITADAALNAEGITMPGGELNTGAYGEGFVDRRHPHTYVHELILTARRNMGPIAVSASAGRGFAPFGTDDPMMRPLVKYPVNHHLAQILERGVAIGAVRFGVAALEASTFAGDEPASPSSLPTLRRFGDSWSVRGTLAPRPGSELQTSYARVASPEEPGGFGLDQRKRSASARVISSDGERYALVEWARTIDRDHSRQQDVFAYESSLAEAAVLVKAIGIAIRLEQTERPEEDRLDDPSRTPRPGSDLSINGITRWRIATLHVAAPSVTWGTVTGFPFVEAALLAAAPRDDRAFFTPVRLYGTTRFTMLSFGWRLRAGGVHARMGRYGVALREGPAIASLSGRSHAAHAH